MQNFFKCCLAYNPPPNSEQKMAQLKLSKKLPTKIISNSSILNTPVSNTHNINFGNSPKKRNLDPKNESLVKEDMRNKEEVKDLTAQGTDIKADMHHLGTPDLNIASDNNNSKEALQNNSISKVLMNFQKIELYITDSKNPSTEKKYIITYEGLVTSQLSIKKSDITFIGAETEQKASPSYISLPEQQRLSQNHFYIKFDKKIFKYYIKDNGSEGGTFVKLQGAMAIQNSLFIAFGEIQIGICVMENKDIKFNILSEEEKEINFSYNDSPINVGRSDKCKLYIKSSGLSRHQCYFECQKNEWWLYDGSVDGTPSTNGTYIFADHDIEISDNMTIKAAETIFRVALIN